VLNIFRKDMTLFSLHERLTALARQENLQMNSETQQNMRQLGKAVDSVHVRVESVHDAVSVIHNEVNKVSSAVNQIGVVSTGAFRNKIRKVIAKVSESAIAICRLSTRLSQIPETDIGKLRNWLSTPDDMVNEYTNFRVSRFPGTCEWFSRNLVYRTWRRDSASSLMWVHGPPGSGKSVLSSYIVEQEFENCIYFFFRFDDETKRTPQALLRSAAFQLAERNERIRNDLCKLCDEGLNLDKLQLGSLWQKLFVEKILRSGVTFYWIIDGLDECIADRGLLVRLMGEVFTSLTTIKVMLVSRFSTDIAEEIRLLATPVYEIVPEDNRNDIVLYVSKKMEEWGSAEHNTTQNALVKEISDRAQGGFLWTRLVLECLEGECNIEGIVEALQKMPDKLATVYERIVDSCLSRLNPSHVSLAKEVFTYVICTARPLSVTEIASALQSRFGTLKNPKATIRDICGSMVRLSPQDTIHTIHMTVRQYLIAGGGEFHIDTPAAETRVATRCLQYLTDELLPDLYLSDSGNVDTFRQAVQSSHPFLDYASTHWVTHLTAACQHLDFQSRIYHFITGPNLLKWLQYIALAGRLDILRVIADNLDAWRCSGGDVCLDEWIKDLRRLASILGHSEENYKGMWVDGRKEGFGEYVYGDGSIYIGQWERDRENGRGKKITGNRVYEGDFQEGLEHGKGKARVTLVGGSFMEYVGEFAFGRQHGWGKETAGSGVVSEGNFKDGLQDGLGTQNLPPGNFYRGNWKAGREHGYGEFKFIDGASYKGEFNMGAFHGNGVYDDGEGNVFDGSWQDGEKHGYGVLRVKDGREFRGIWTDGILPEAPPVVQAVAKAASKSGVLTYKNGDTWIGEKTYSRPHGQGTYTYAINKSSYHGSFSHGRFHGHIIETSPTMGKYAEGDYKDGRLYGYGWQNFPGGSYRGEYKARLYDGRGLLETPEQIYDGEWKANKRNGKGKGIYKNGQTYDGEWFNDAKHGNGIFQFGDGITCVGNWTHGRMIVPCKLSFSGEWEKGWQIGAIRRT
jgi:hypothetical protein